MRVIKRRMGYLFAMVAMFSSCSTTPDNPEWVINEVMVVNKSNYMDCYGQRHPWIEIYNNTAKTMDIGGRYLTNDPDNPKKYAIPRGDVLTSVKPHQQVLFLADEMPLRGTFHLNFTLDSTKENWIGLYDNDGKTLLDEIVIPAGMQADQTFGYEKDGIKYDANGNNTAQILDRVTPSSNNSILEENPKVKYLVENDADGGLLTITSMLVVFLGLIALYFFFKLSGNIATRMSQRQVAKSGTLSAVRSHSHLSGEVLAAISAAIYELKEDQHDIESTILTIHQVKRNFSPWNTKRQSLRELPR